MKGIVYRLYDLETKEIYIGSTLRTIQQRINQHRGQDSCRGHDIVCRNNFRIQILETIDFGNIVETRLKECEQKYMDKSENIVNNNRAFGNKCDKTYYKNYYQQNKDKYIKKRTSKEAYAWQRSWGGKDNNLININMNCFN